MSDPFPEIKSKHSLVAKYVTQPLWEKLSKAVTVTSGFTLAKAIACAVQFDNQHCGIYAGDWDSYKVRIKDISDCLQAIVGFVSRCSLMSSTPSSRTTMASPLTAFTPATWMCPRSTGTSTPPPQFTPPGSGSVAASMGSGCLPELPSSRGWTWRA